MTRQKVIALRLVGGAIALWGTLSLIGVLVKHVFAYGRAGSWDRSVDVWFVAHRTTSLNTLTSYANDLANTRSVVGITIVIALLLRWRMGRWNESWIILTVMIGEVVVFLAVTLTVRRPRPSVVQLDKAPPTSSFPSGHTMASMACYGAIAILLLWIYGRNWKSLTVATLLFCIPILVALSRLYRGMHFPTDVISGAFGGAVWLFIVTSTLRPKDGKMKHAGLKTGELR
ncbi:MAG TPA: phosphatase PAP2 family protein [Candidatus Nanopelagicaceae bacterium]